MAGLSTTNDRLFVADRNEADTEDIFRCLKAETGEELWAIREPSQGKLDYGNAPRATPTVAGDLVVFHNAFGLVLGVRINSGQVVWKKNLWDEFGGKDRRNPWGTSSSPLLVDNLLIVNPGGPKASVVALRPETGEAVWKCPGDLAAFASFVVGELGGKRQIVGYEKQHLVGIQVADGKRLWTLKPPQSGDFNVPTPIITPDGKLIVSTENNGTRLFGFDDEGRICPEPIAVNEDLAPDTHSPILLGDRIFGVWLGMNCIQVTDDGLTTVWREEEEAFEDYAVVMGHQDRVLVISKFGDLILLDAKANRFQPLSRISGLFDGDSGVYSHPAMIGTRLFLRGSAEVICVELASEAK